jgi:hypothetical protein
MDFDEERDYAESLLIEALSQLWTWRKTPRFYPDCSLPQQSESGGIVHPQDRFRLDGGRPGVVCAPSTLLQLHLVSTGSGTTAAGCNIWMWRYGRNRPRMVSIVEAERIRVEPLSESRTRATETRRSEAAAAAGAAQGGGGPAGPGGAD